MQLLDDLWLLIVVIPGLFFSFAALVHLMRSNSFVSEVLSARNGLINVGKEKYCNYLQNVPP